MPSLPKRLCREPGCMEYALPGESRCAKHIGAYRERQQEQKRIADTRRESAHKRGYDSRWAKARTGYLAHHPLCAECERMGRLTPATVVDHIIPHRGDKGLFWDRQNWAGLCRMHHNQKTAREDGGFGNKRK